MAARRLEHDQPSTHLTSPAQHIALVGPAYPYRGGIVHFMETMHQGMAARGHDVSAVTFRRQYPELLFPGKTQYAAGPGPDLPRAPRLIDSINPLSWWQTARHLRALAPDAVVFQHWMPAFAPAYGTIARLLRRAGVRNLAVVHNALPHERRPGDRLLSRYFFDACDGFVVMSEAVEADLRGLGAGAPVQRVKHPAYDRFGEAPPTAAAREKLGLPPEAPVLLFFGFIRRYKGLHVLLDAMPRILEALPDAHLLVAGEFYDDEEPYYSLIRQNDLQERVHLFAEYIPDEEVPALFAAADLVVQPYVSATQSGVAQIAFHFETPVVVTDVGGLAEVVPHERAGLVVPPADPDALADAVARFFHEEMSERLVSGVREEKARHGWQPLYEALEALL